LGGNIECKLIQPIFEVWVNKAEEILKYFPGISLT